MPSQPAVGAAGTLDRRVASSRRGRGDRGMVTAETAILLPGLALLLAGILWVIAGVAGELRCVDAAREAARVAARGDAVGQAAAVARRIAPAGAVVRIDRGGGVVTAVVTARQAPFAGWAGRLGSWPLHATASVTDESTDGAALTAEVPVGSGGP